MLILKQNVRVSVYTKETSLYRRNLRRRGGKSGYMRGLTLVELIVAMAIFILGIAGFSMMFADSWRSNAFIFETGQSAWATSNAVETMVNDIRRVR